MGAPERGQSDYVPVPRCDKCNRILDSDAWPLCARCDAEDIRIEQQRMREA